MLRLRIVGKQQNKRYRDTRTLTLSSELRLQKSLSRLLLVCKHRQLGGAKTIPEIPSLAISCTLNQDHSIIYHRARMSQTAVRNLLALRMALLILPSLEIQGM